MLINDGNHTAADAVYAALVLSGVIVSNWPSSLAALTAWLQRRPQVTTTRKLPVVPTLEEAMQEEIRRWQRELGDSSRVLYWRSATEPGAFRVMVEGSRESTPDQVSQLSEAICQSLQALAEQAGETANR